MMDSHRKDNGWWKKMELQVKICYNIGNDFEKFYIQFGGNGFDAG